MAQSTYPFRCPHCPMTYTGSADRAGEAFDCMRCGRRVEVPTGPWGGDREESSRGVSRPSELPPSRVPALDAVVVEEDDAADHTAGGLLVRCCFDGREVRAFRTDLPMKEFLEELDDLLERQKLDRDRDGTVQGAMRYQWEVLYNVRVEGVARPSSKGPGFRIDLSFQHSMAGLGIVLCIVMFPLGLVGMLVLGGMIPQDARRAIESLYRDLKQAVGGRKG